MASFAVKSSFCILLALFCFTLNVEAREGKLFFSKFTHLAANKEVGPSPKPAPVVALAPSPAPDLALVEGRLGDGHFGPGSGMIPQTKESWSVPSTTSDEEFEKLMAKFDTEKGDEKTEEFVAENYDNNKLTEEFEDGEVSEDSEDPSEQKGKYYNNNNKYTYSATDKYKSSSNNNVRGYGEERQGMSDTRFMENGNYFYDVNEHNYEKTPTPSNYERSNNNYNENARQGMSDTRFMENGRYFHGVSDRDDENAPTRYSHEFDTMEEYYKSLEGSEESMP